MDKNVLTLDIAEPLTGVKTARLLIHAGDGNMTIDTLAPGEPVLVRGTLEYFEKQGAPRKTMSLETDQAVFTLQGSPASKPMFHLPWSACNGATNWAIHLTPDIPASLTAHSDGGNLSLDLAGMLLSEVSAVTGGGNIDLLLPENLSNMIINAKTGAGNLFINLGKRITGRNTVQVSSGAGNVTITIPAGIAARIHATSGLGGTSVDSKFKQIDKDTYQSPDFDSAGDKIEINAKSGAGVVTVTVR